MKKKDNTSMVLIWIVIGIVFVICASIGTYNQNRDNQLQATRDSLDTANQRIETAKQSINGSYDEMNNALDDLQPVDQPQ